MVIKRVAGGCRIWHNDAALKILGGLGGCSNEKLGVASKSQKRWHVNQMMEAVLDTSVIIALLSSEAERDTIIEEIDGKVFLCPESVVAEIGNSLSAMFKRNRITLKSGKEIIVAFQNLKIKLLPIDLNRSLEICNRYKIYAYDAYVLECAERKKCDLVTLDKRMKEVAKELNLSIIEV